MNDIFSLIKPKSAFSCSECVCNDCLNWQKGTCPYGGCYDDLRAKERPYTEEYPGEVRKAWSDWNKKGEQEHWCRGGVFYPQLVCEHYVFFKGLEIKECLYAPVAVFQDGSISCSLVDTVGCEECYKRFEKEVR